MLFALAIAAVASATQPQSPTGKWVVEYDQDMCVLSRTYGMATDEVTVALRPNPMGTGTELVLLTAAPLPDVVAGKAQLTLLPAEHTSAGSFSRYKLSQSAKSIATVTFDQDAFAGIQTATALAIRLGSDEPYTVAIPNIAAGMDALRVCQADLLRTWGIDSAEQQTVVTPPKGNPGSFFGVQEYPSDAVRAHEQGKAIAVATVKTDGHVEACTIAVSSGSASLDRATCEILMRRGHFVPGADRNGKPVVAHVVVPVRWRLPA